MVGNRGQAFGTVILPQFLVESVAFVPGKIHIDVGRIFSLRVEKAAKKEVVTNGVHVRDPQEIAHQARCGTAAAAMNGTPPHNVGYHQKVVHVAFGVNQCQLFRETLFKGGIVLPVTPANPLAAFL